mmetsp:Transcript_81237/g.143274  ORF Transcript_81237/g.143274 Transcript_81237/m.143274 type:complete len:357 (-) Transcript_81237:126-1196(-)
MALLQIPGFDNVAASSFKQRKSVSGLPSLEKSITEDGKASPRRRNTFSAQDIHLPELPNSPTNQMSMGLMATKATLHLPESPARSLSPSRSRAKSPTVVKLESLKTTESKLRQDQERSERLRKARSKLVSTAHFLGAMMSQSRDGEEVEKKASWNIEVARTATEKKPDKPEIAFGAKISTHRGRSRDKDEKNERRSSSGSVGSSGRRNSKSRSNSAKRRAQEISDEISDEQIGEFLHGCFQAYSLLWDVQGRPLINNTALRRFFKAFVAASSAEHALAKADECYAEEIERQEQLHYSFDLTKKDARRGLCFKMFVIVLNSVFPGGVSQDMARERFRQFHGSATLMAQRLSPDLRNA